VLAQHPLLAERIADPASPLPIELVSQRIDHFGPA
jgi:hypothetical protein